MDYIFFFLGVALGGILIWIFISGRLSKRLDVLEAKIQSFGSETDRLERALREEFSQSRKESLDNSKGLREELNLSLTEIGKLLITQISDLTGSNEKRLAEMRQTIEERLGLLQKENSEKLDEMRQLVDKKLHSTLEKRLGEAFKLVSERLEMVHKGLGEMQNLAVGVGDLKKILSNVKTKGVLGEFQLGGILEQILSPEQYDKNVRIKKNSREAVEFAIKLPGDGNQPVYLPIDSKFPTEGFQALQEAYERADHNQIEQAIKNIETTITKYAKDIKEKYIEPPHTTDFAIMFLPYEGLYAEVVRRTQLIERLHREFKITITGPTTLAAFLNSLQMGFMTLAIQKRSQEVWNVLNAVKKDFGRFGELLEKTKKKIEEARDTLDEASKKQGTIERHLRDVQKLPDVEIEPEKLL